MQYLITSCESHGVKVANDRDSAIYWATEMGWCGELPDNAHEIMHDQTGTDCFWCCDDMVIDYSGSPVSSIKGE